MSAVYMVGADHDADRLARTTAPTGARIAARPAGRGTARVAADAAAGRLRAVWRRQRRDLVRRVPCAVFRRRPGALPALRQSAAAGRHRAGAGRRCRAACQMAARDGSDGSDGSDGRYGAAPWPGQRAANDADDDADVYAATTQPPSARLERLGDSPHDQLCGQCLSQPPAFDATLVAADYAVPLDQLVLQLKFGGRLALAALFARCLRDAVLQQPGFVLPALLCPVPLGPRRLAERGYNQALEIARPLARSLGVALHPRLAQRVYETQAQSRVTPDQRRDNIAGAFAITDGGLVDGRHIGIVDDVMTSGQTLNELAATFKRYGAARVTNLVFARTPPHH